MKFFTYIVFKINHKKIIIWYHSIPKSNIIFLKITCFHYLIHITIEINIIEKNLFYGTVLDCTSMYKSLKYVGIETPK